MPFGVLMTMQHSHSPEPTFGSAPSVVGTGGQQSTRMPGPAWPKRGGGYPWCFWRPVIFVEIFGAGRLCTEGCPLSDIFGERW